MSKKESYTFDDAVAAGLCPFCDSNPCQHLDECSSFAAFCWRFNRDKTAKRKAAESIDTVGQSET